MGDPGRWLDRRQIPSNMRQFGATPAKSAEKSTEQICPSPICEREEGDIQVDFRCTPQTESAPAMSLSNSPLHQPRHQRVDLDSHLQDRMTSAVSDIADAAVRVQVFDDEVLLHGHVSCWHHKQWAQESIRLLAGYRLIRNNLDVRKS